MTEMISNPEAEDKGDGIKTTVAFSRKRADKSPYNDFHEKIWTYVQMIWHEAQTIDPDLRPEEREAGTGGCRGTGARLSLSRYGNDAGRHWCGDGKALGDELPSSVLAGRVLTFSIFSLRRRSEKFISTTVTHSLFTTLSGRLAHRAEATLRNPRRLIGSEASMTGCVWALSVILIMSWRINWWSSRGSISFLSRSTMRKPAKLFSKD